MPWRFQIVNAKEAWHTWKAGGRGLVGGSACGAAVKGPGVDISL